MKSSFSLRRLGVIMPISSARVFACEGGSWQTINAPYGTEPRYSSICGPMSCAPSALNAGSPKGPVAALTAEKRSSSRYTASASS